MLHTSNKSAVVLVKQIDVCKLKIVTKCRDNKIKKMKQLRFIISRSFYYLLFIILLFILYFFHIGIKEITGSSVVTSTSDLATFHIDAHNESLKNICDDGCECIKYNCGCCQHLEIDALSLNGTLCTNVSYLDHDYGISITVTYNTFVIINETVSARNPPPICIGEDIFDAVECEVCLRIYDIDIDVKHERFHACFEILGKIMKIKFSAIPLGCVDTNCEKMRYVADTTFNLTTVIVKLEQTIVAHNQGSLPSHLLVDVFLFFYFFLLNFCRL